MPVLRLVFGQKYFCKEQSDSGLDLAEDQLNTCKFGKLKTTSNLLNSAGKTGLRFLSCAREVQFCGDVVLAGVVKSCWMKSSWMGLKEAGTDKEGANEK